MRIAIIEDDRKIRVELSKLLEKNNYQTILLTDFSNIIKNIQEQDIDLILLDVNLPYENGYELCKKIKKQKNIPIIFVTSRSTDEDELKSIQVGGLDFITKPYNKSILLEKIKRSLQTTNPRNYQEITKKGYTLDLHLSILKYQGKQIELTRNEFKILYYFFIEEERVITKDELLEWLWNDKYYLDESILLVNINRLRKKAKDIGIDNILQTVRKMGYQL